MRNIKFVKGLVIDDVPIVGNPAEHKYHTFTSDGNVLDVSVKEHVVPVTYFGFEGKPGVYIAYSEEVEEALGIPISILLKERKEFQERYRLESKDNMKLSKDIQDLEDRVWRYNRLPWWKKMVTKI